ncbi:MAG: DUF4037 domain-containing protein [Eubacteriales bacterium]|nr:DUF4037 domain-containing protein [Eubacteriales bacterium]
MKGLELSRQYYEAYGKDMIDRFFPAYADRIAVGLVGEGSECFGFDDEISHDHDFGPSFCLWLTAQDYADIGESLKEKYAQLPGSFAGFAPRLVTPLAGDRVGVLEIDTFFTSLVGVPHAPEEEAQWLYLNEQMLAAATNGMIFSDPLGEFTRVRNGFLQYYPENIRLQKIASAVALLSQAGQYNLPRSLKREAFDTAYLCVSEFIQSTIALTYLLNQKYMPFYKWMLRGMDDFAILPQIKPMLQELMRTGGENPRCCDIVEDICAQLLSELKRQKITDSDDDFLLNHVEHIAAKCTNAS